MSHGPVCTTSPAATEGTARRPDSSRRLGQPGEVVQVGVQPGAKTWHVPWVGHEVKGSFFVIARKLIREGYPEREEEFAKALRPEVRESYEDALASQWLPEEHLQEMLGALRSVVARGDHDRFEALLEESVQMGVHRFFTALLSLASARFVLRRIPVLWRLIRRGGSRVRVESHPDGTMVCYQAFPFFDDPVYETLTRASIQVLLRLTGERGVVRVERRSGSELHILGLHR